MVLVSFKLFALFHSSVRERAIEKNTNTMGGKPPGLKELASLLNNYQYVEM